ncbi:hypothetical protein [Kribbella sp. NPDC006257]|uniref:hypothetical protein n=1 Tax=Kribbella sp. NPDC006257 TaxID=3156738 RepID=UPI0033B112FA
MTNKTNHITGTATPCASWCSPKNHLLCGGPICCPHLHAVPTTKRQVRKAKKAWTRSGW